LASKIKAIKKGVTPVIPFLLNWRDTNYFTLAFLAW
jgi:hypothetical protein